MIIKKTKVSTGRASNGYLENSVDPAEQDKATQYYRVN